MVVVRGQDREKRHKETKAGVREGEGRRTENKTEVRTVKHYITAIITEVKNGTEDKIGIGAGTHKNRG